MTPLNNLFAIYVGRPFKRYWSVGAATAQLVEALRTFSSA